jgi:hypothetical protein
MRASATLPAGGAVRNPTERPGPGTGAQARPPGPRLRARLLPKGMQSGVRPARPASAVLHLPFSGHSDYNLRPTLKDGFMRLPGREPPRGGRPEPARAARARSRAFFRPPRPAGAVPEAPGLGMPPSSSADWLTRAGSALSPVRLDRTTFPLLPGPSGLCPLTIEPLTPDP